MGNNSRIELDLGRIEGKLDRLGDRIPIVVGGIVERRADIATAWMKDNATWTDRTGNARSGLRAEPEHTGTSHIIHLMHSVAYGIWLEVRWGGKYAVIIPAIVEQGKGLMEDLNALMRRL